MPHVNVFLKKKATALRRRGYSYPMIGAELGVSRSTLSGWLSALSVSPAAHSKILQRKKDNLQAARLKAVGILRTRYAAERQKVVQAVESDFSILKLSKNCL